MLMTLADTIVNDSFTTCLKNNPMEFKKIKWYPKSDKSIDKEIGVQILLVQF